MVLFKRTWRLNININGINKTYQELDISDTSLKIEFETHNAIKSLNSGGQLNIVGLTNRDISFLSTNFKNGVLVPSLITLEAGYANELALILNGNIVSIEPDFTNPDTSLKIEIMTGINNNLANNYIIDSIKGITTFRDLCIRIAKNNDLTLKYDDTILNKIIEDYAFNGTPLQQIKQLQDLNTNANISIDKKHLLVTNKTNNNNTKIIINSNNGLIGTPKPTAIGCEITTLLRPSLLLSDIITLESVKLPQLNGDYSIIQISHKGTNKGDAWYSNLLLSRANYA